MGADMIRVSTDSSAFSSPLETTRLTSVRLAQHDTSDINLKRLNTLEYLLSPAVMLFPPLHLFLHFTAIKGALICPLLPNNPGLALVFSHSPHDSLIDKKKTP